MTIAIFQLIFHVLFLQGAENTILQIESKLFEVLTHPELLDEEPWLPLRDAILQHALPALMKETLSDFATCQVSLANTEADLKQATAEKTRLALRVTELEHQTESLDQVLQLPADWISSQRQHLLVSSRQRLTTRTADKTEGIYQPAILDTESELTNRFLNLTLYDKSNLLSNKERDRLKLIYPPLEGQFPDAPIQKAIPAAKLSEDRLMKSNMEQWLRLLFIFQQGMDAFLHRNWSAALRSFSHSYIYTHNVLSHQFFKRVEVEQIACGADPEECVLQKVSTKLTLTSYEERDILRKRRKEETDRKLQQQILSQLIKQNQQRPRPAPSQGGKGNFAFKRHKDASKQINTPKAETGHG